MTAGEDGKKMLEVCMNKCEGANGACALSEKKKKLNAAPGDELSP